MRQSSGQERKPDVFTWPVHGSYMYYLSQGDYNLYIPVDGSGMPGYGGRGDLFPFADNVVEIPAEEVRCRSFDAILFQSANNYLEDAFSLFSEKQLEHTPRFYLEHDPPRKHPTDTRHVVEDARVPVVHVTAFNRLMWHNTGPTRVIEHGVTPPPCTYTGELARGVVVINNLRSRGRRLGADIFLHMREQYPLDLVGMDSESLGGLGEIPLPRLPAFLRRYRFFFNPIRYTSLGLAVCEAMMLGMPVVGLATTEMVTAVEDGVSGYLDTDLRRLGEKMRLLLDNPQRAAIMGQQAHAAAASRFALDRFTAQWASLFREAAGLPSFPVTPDGDHAVRPKMLAP